ncbi:MAG: YegS/Rv2252/BmrU family lipid kinase, partial [Spirochaetales bacterium]|nr:YegS/Rv2252/BmrU family lipid kinase [Spirochaetales bacterium]
MKYLIIYNTHAANNKAAKKVAGVKQCLDDTGIDYTVEYTEHAGHGVEIANAQAGNFDVLVAAGGDGTANEVINGIMRYKESADSRANVPAFGMLCVGRGNDFAFGAGVPRKLDEACAALRENRRKRIDVGCITGPEVDGKRYFGNGIGMGFDTIVGLEAAKLTWAQGFLGYFIGALKTMFFYFRAPALSIKTDSFEEVKRAIMVSVMNGRRMGGTFYMAPDSKNDDGEFDLCIAGEPTRRQMIPLIAKFLKGTQGDSPHILMTRSRRVVVESPDGML